MNKNPEEGDKCQRYGCEGHLILPPVEGCICFQGNPPCSACTDNVYVCNVCESSVDDVEEYPNDICTLKQSEWLRGLGFKSVNWRYDYNLLDLIFDRYENNWNSQAVSISAPLHHEALAYLRTRNVFISANAISNKSGYIFCYRIAYANIVDYEDFKFTSHEEAISAALNFCIENDII